MDVAEELRQAVSVFVRTIRNETGTPRTAKSDTLELLERDGALNVARLAQLRNVKHQSMRLVIAQLEADQLVRRNSDGADGRSQLVTITGAGRRWLQRSRKVRTQRIAEMIESRLLTEDRDAVRAAACLLTRLAAATKHSG